MNLVYACALILVETPPQTITNMAQTGFDRRRVNGPEESFSPIFEDSEEDVIIESSETKARRGRSAKDIRPICAKFSLIWIFFFKCMKFFL